MRSALVVHDSLNAGGGSEKLATITIETLNELGFTVDIATATNPRIDSLEQSFGHGMDLKIRDIKPLEVWADMLKAADIEYSAIDEDDYDLIINTHGDLLVYYNKSKSKNTTKITYCHYPLLPSLSSSSAKAYEQMMLNTKVLTNSEYSKAAIKQMYNGIEPTMLYPPVDTQTFGKVNNKQERQDIILVVSRFSPDKDIVRAIRIAKTLRDRGIGKRMVVVGNVTSRDSFSYLYELVDLIERYGLERFVKLKFNASLDELLELMQKSKVYLHPLAGEPFGISISEAMAAGLTPVVPDIGGSTEFVPKEYQFKTNEQAVDIIEKSLKDPKDMSNLVSRFSTEEYKTRLKAIINSLL